MLCPKAPLLLRSRFEVANYSSRVVEEWNIYHVVVAGREQSADWKEDFPPMHMWTGARFNNSLQPQSLARIRRVVDVASSLVTPQATADVVAAAGAEQDPKGALGALRMLDVEGVVHARSGGRRQLVWHAGPRSDEAEPPRLAERERYSRLRGLLRRNTDRWHSTDWLIVEADFDPDLELRSAGDWETRRGLSHGLPVNFFLDHGKSARKYVLGALKALYWLEHVAWRNSTRQAVGWRWVAPVEGRVRVPPISWRSKSIDPYLLDESPPSRRERLAAGGAERREIFAAEAQQWIRDNYPEAAQRYEDDRRRRADELAKRREAELREAARWMGG